MTLAREQGFPYWLAGAPSCEAGRSPNRGSAQRGWPRYARAWRPTRLRGQHWNGRIVSRYWPRRYGKAGQADEGLRISARRWQPWTTTGERFYEAELYRLQGELVMALAADKQPEAEACFQQALTVARQQEAKWLELRAAMSLARLWQQQGKRTDAYDLLAPIYGWFTEGFDTADLQEAKALLEELA